jgi:hypothetical protein
MIKLIKSKSMGTYYFPHVTEFKDNHNQTIRHCEKLQSISKLDSLGMVAVKPIEYQVPVEVPFISMAIPVNYKLNAYRPFTDNYYVPKHEGRILKLRMGAEDELTQIDTLSIMPVAAADKHEKHEPHAPKSSRKEAAHKHKVREEPKVVAQPEATVHQTQIVDLKPSKWLCEHVEYPPIHIFVNINSKFQIIAL